MVRWARLRTGVVNSVKQESEGVYKYQCVSSAVLGTHAAHQLLVVRTVSVELTAICSRYRLVCTSGPLSLWILKLMNYVTVYFQGYKPTCVLE